MRVRAGSRSAGLVAAVVALMAVTAIAVIAQQTPGTLPPRDTPAQRSTPQTPEGHISGRVLTADTGRPVTRARVLLSGTGLPGGRATLTDENGAFDLTDLPAGRYTLSVSKAGFITLSYGQRRPLMAGTPLQLADDQEIKGIEFRLPRGSAISGHVFDETGDPLPGANVRVMRYQYQQGNRVLVPAGNAQTDDQGYYRIWGLDPGEYYVNAVTRIFGGGRGGPPPFAGGFGPGGGRGGRGGPSAGAPSERPEPVDYAPTFYPGVPSVAEARAVAVTLGADAVNIDFGMLLVRTARISGYVTNPDGSPTTAGQLTLTPDAANGRSSRMVARIQWDGRFALPNVPPGRYILRARSDDTVQPQYTAQPISVTDVDIEGLTVILAPGGTITGTVTFENTGSAQLPDPSQVRIFAPLVDDDGFGPMQMAGVNAQGRFTMDGVAAGAHWIRTQGPLRGWTLKSVLVDGREMTDAPIDVRSGGRVNNVTVVFTDRLTEVNGTLSDDRGNPITEYTVLAFPTDPTLWRPQARQIMTARPDQNGKYQIRGLPPGEYYLVAVDPAEPGEWFEPAFLEQHRIGAASLRLGEGETKTQDFKVAP